LTEYVAITGGAGYIGGIVANSFLGSGSNVLILDNLSEGNIQVVNALQKRYGKDRVLYRNVDITDYNALREACRVPINGFVDFAAKISVGESQQKCLEYFQTNNIGFLNLLLVAGDRPIVKSLTAAIYGTPRDGFLPLKETYHADIRAQGKGFKKSQLMQGAANLEEMLGWYKEHISGQHKWLGLTPEQIIDSNVPTSVYGLTKLWDYFMLQNREFYTGGKFIGLPYFNAAGALNSPELRLGEAHRIETHLIPTIFEAAMGGIHAVPVFGEKRKLRDYVDVKDLAEAHVLCFDSLLGNGESKVFNLGTGRQYDTKDIMIAAAEIIGIPIPYMIVPDRAGDSRALAADTTAIQQALGWSATIPLRQMLTDAFKWQSNPPPEFQALMKNRFPTVPISLSQAKGKIRYIRQ